MNIFVENLSRQVTEEDLKVMFGVFGQVSKVTISNDKLSDAWRNSGFVVMPDEDQARQAIAMLNQKELKGRVLQVSEARPMTERPRRGEAAELVVEETMENIRPDNTTSATRLDRPVSAGSGGGGAILTRRDNNQATPTRRDGTATPTVGGQRNSTFTPYTGHIHLPAELAKHYEILEPLHTHGAEADIFLVNARNDAQRYVVKLYHRGIAPKVEVLERIAKSRSEHVIRLYDYGRANDVWYEVLEHAEHGSLKEMLAPGEPLAPEMVRTILIELNEAISHIHEQTASGVQLVHRDIKPANILIRSREPLDLVLADFGITSVLEGSQRGTNTSRTTMYAAPEAASGIIGPQVDYWSLGMILLEAFTGRHPFENLSDAVISHHLATRAIDVSAIPEPWQILCRGLLMRNPKNRWGSEEIRRWLDGDKTLAINVEADDAYDDSAGIKTRFRPYKFVDKTYDNPRDLAHGLASRWEDAKRDLERGYISKWIVSDIGDQNLARDLDDICERWELSGNHNAWDSDIKLFHAILVLGPDLPPVFMGYPITPTGVDALASAAIAGDARAQQVLKRIFENHLLQACAERKRDDSYKSLDERWHASWSEHQRCCNSVIDKGGPAQDFLSLDAVLSGLWFGIRSKEHVGNLRKQAAQASSDLARACPWFLGLGDVNTASPPALQLMSLLAPSAIEATRKRKEQERAARSQRRRARLAGIVGGFVGLPVGAVAGGVVGFVSALAVYVLVAILSFFIKNLDPERIAQIWFHLSILAGLLLGIVKGAKIARNKLADYGTLFVASASFLALGALMYLPIAQYLTKLTNDKEAMNELRAQYEYILEGKKRPVSTPHQGNISPTVPASRKQAAVVHGSVSAKNQAEERVRPETQQQVSLYLMRADAAMQEGDFKAARQYLNKAGGLSPNAGDLQMAYKHLSDRKSAAEAYDSGRYTDAFRLLSPFAERSESWAQSRLGMMFLRGDGVAENDSRGVYLIGDAAARGDAESEYQLGLMYSAGSHGLPRNPQKALDLFRKAAHQGHVKARAEGDMEWRRMHGLPVSRRY